MPNIVKKYKVVDSRLQFINDVDASYDDGNRAAVTIVQPIGVSCGQIIQEEFADVEMWNKSLRTGLIRKFINDGLIKEVYIDDKTKEEKTEDEYKKSLLPVGDASEADKIAKVLASRGLTAEKVAAILDDAESGDVNEGDVNEGKGDEKVTEATQKVIKREVLLERKPEHVEMNVIITDAPKTYDEYSKIPYQRRLGTIKIIINKELLNDILQKDKSALSIRTVNKRLRDLGAT